MTHKLKLLPQYFERVLTGEKTFETRKNDRGFQKDDIVILNEYDPSVVSSFESAKYTGRNIKATIGFVLSEYQKEGYVTFSLINPELL